MANKSKIINAAQKYISKGQWDRAIKELQKLVAEDPSDVRTLLKLGDVYSKKGDREEASRVYKQVAESYSEQGFFLKAVAVYKQILKHDPKHLEVTLKLAELYEHLGLQSEAMQQYTAAAAIHDEAGDTKQSLEVLERMVELDAENVASRIKLAESYSREGMVAQAVEQFERASEVLKAQARIDDYLKVAERLVYHAPDRLQTVMELAKLYLSRGDTKRALAKLQICFKANPRDIQTLRLLAQAFNDLGQTQKTVFVYRELARIYEEAGQPDEARSVLQMILEVDPNDGEARQALGLGAPSQPEAPVPYEEPIFAATPEPAPQAFEVTMGEPEEMPGEVVMAPSLAPRPRDAAIPSDDEVLILDAPEDVVAAETVPPRPPPRADDREQISKILTETDVYIKYGLREKALDHLRSVFDLDPDNVGAYYKMRDIYASIGDNARAAEALANLLHVHARRGDVDALNATREELRVLAPGHPLVAGGLPGAIPPPIEEEDDQLSIDITEDSSDFLVDFSEDSEEFPAPDSIDLPQPEDSQEAEAPFDPVMMEAPIEMDADLEVVDEQPAPDAPDFSGFETLNPPADIDDTNESPAYRGPLSTGPVPADADELPVVTDSQFAIIDEPTSSADLPVRRAPLRPPTFDLLDDQVQNPGFDSDDSENVTVFGSPPAIDMDGEIDAGMMNELSGPVAVPEEIAEPTMEPATDGAAAAAAAADDEAIDDELDEAEFLVEAKLLDEAREALEDILERAPNNARAKELFKATVDLESAEADEDAAPEPVVEAQAEDELDLGDDFADAAGDALDMFAEDDGPAMPSSSPIVHVDGAEPTAEDRYDQGMAFRELGRYDDAIREFESALESEARRVTAYEMIGHCYLDKNQPEEAIGYFSQAMEAGADGFALINLKYEVGAAYAACGDMDAAVQWFYACARDDPHHRGVVDRLKEMGVNLSADDVPMNGSSLPDEAEAAEPEPEPQPSHKKNKISYL